MLRLITDAEGRATVDHITDRVADEERVSSQEIAFSRRALTIAPDGGTNSRFASRWLNTRSRWSRKPTMPAR